MGRRILFAVLAIILASTVASSPVGAGTLSITDDFGRNVTLEKIPERIISLSPANTEILFAIGAGDRVVGVTEYCNYPAEAEEREEVGGVSTVSIEKVVSLEPDLVLGDELNGKETFERLEELNITVVGLNPVNVSGILDDIILVGKITGEETNASALVTDMERRLEEIKNKTRDVKRPKVALITWHDPIWVAGSGTVQDEVIEIAGGENLFSDLNDWDTVSLETFIDRNPDVIIVSVGHGVAGMQPYDYILSEERLKVVNAVKNDRVYTIDADVISRAGPRIVNATETLYGYLHESPTVAPTPVPTPMPGSSGFETVLAVLGLLSVRYLLRRKKENK
ncbi:MAG: helical backbone metal receptor [Candidatus Methanospirareceae archaeon]